MTVTQARGSCRQNRRVERLSQDPAHDSLTKGPDPYFGCAAIRALRVAAIIPYIYNSQANPVHDRGP
jgi:hypothetical protein